MSYIRNDIPDVALDAAYHLQTLELVRDFLAVNNHRKYGGQVSHDGRHLAGSIDDLFTDIEAACVRIEEDARGIVQTDEPEPSEFDVALAEADWRRKLAQGDVA